MADEEHLRILRQGVSAWSKWRHEFFDIRPNLRAADLRGARLSQADLYTVLGSVVPSRARPPPAQPPKLALANGLTWHARSRVLRLAGLTSAVAAWA